MTEENLARANVIKSEINRLHNRLDIYIQNKEITESNCGDSSDITIHNPSDVIDGICIADPEEVAEILDMLINKTSLDLKKLEEEFRNL